MKDNKLSGRIWLALFIFGLFGQIAWSIENMYFNVFLYKTIASNQTGIDAIAVMVSASAITATVTTLIMGALSDKVAKRKVFIVSGYLIWGVIIMAFAFITTENTAKLFPQANVVTATIAIVVVMDCLMTFFGSTANDASFNAWVTDVTVPSNRGKAEGLLAALPLIAMLIVFGGFDGLTRNGKWKEFFIIIGGMVILGGFAGLFIIKDKCVEQTGNKSYFMNIIYGFRPSVIKKNKPLYILLIATAIFCTAQQVFMPYLLIYIEYYLKITDYAIILGVVLILASVISVVMGRLVDKYGKHKFLLISPAIFTVGLILMFLLGKYMMGNKTFVTAMLTLFGTIMMAGSLVLMLVLTAGTRDYIPDEQRGHYAGIRMIFFVLIPMIIGPFIGSRIISSSGLTYTDPLYNIKQTIPNPEIFLGGAVISLLSFIPIVFILFNMKQALPNEKLLTVWGEELDINAPLPEYPRPQLIRDSYLNLNGVWEYAIYNKDQEFKGYQGEIVVPFSPESLLSGVNRILKPDEILYYKRTFKVGKAFIKDKTLINFGAVDYECKVKLNGIDVGGHKGGFTAFSLDVTEAVKAGENTIEVIVTDPTDTGYISRGKQKLNRGGIWYTPQSGIWQTVWMESVLKTHIVSLKLTPDIDNNAIIVRPFISGKASKIMALITDKEGGKIETELKADYDNIIVINNPVLWSPENPYLYDIVVTADGDSVKSYFGMRKYSVGRDDKGIMRLFLNNKPYFHNGLLDQGYWSDGLLTPPSDEAMRYDIVKMKELGFNMLRKHIKIEPLRWYYHCDREGMLVWQDMINGGGKYSLAVIGLLPFIGINLKDSSKNYKLFGRTDEAGREEYYTELGEMIEHLYNTVSLSVWVPFNEAWGQFDANKAVDFIKNMDTTRIIDHASGWHDQGGGDLKSLHIYFTKVTLPKESDRAIVLSEFGGYSHKVTKHVFNEERIFGYRIYKNHDSFKEGYIKLFENQIIPLIDKGLSATVYTQVSDVEDEINGILTYDRKVSKLTPDDIRELNSRVKL
jgi:MFS family permease